MNNRIRTFIDFGEMPLKTIVTFLYCIGCVIIIYKAFIWGKSIYLTTFLDKQISYMQDGQRWYSSETVNNVPLGVLGFIIYFVVFSLVWKLICELIYIIFERIARK
jgi:hypothetical protein